MLKRNESTVCSQRVNSPFVSCSKGFNPEPRNRQRKAAPRTNSRDSRVSEFSPGLRCATSCSTTPAPAPSNSPSRPASPLFQSYYVSAEAERRPSGPSGDARWRPSTSSHLFRSSYDFRSFRGSSDVTPLIALCHRRTESSTPQLTTAEHPAQAGRRGRLRDARGQEGPRFGQQQQLRGCRHYLIVDSDGTQLGSSDRRRFHKVFRRRRRRRSLVFVDGLRGYVLQQSLSRPAFEQPSGVAERLRQQLLKHAFCYFVYRSVRISFRSILEPRKFALTCQSVVRVRDKILFYINEYSVSLN